MKKTNIFSNLQAPWNIIIRCSEFNYNLQDVLHCAIQHLSVPSSFHLTPDGLSQPDLQTSDPFKGQSWCPVVACFTL